MEPLNLVKRKNRPVAVVAPSTVVSPPSVAVTTSSSASFPSSLLSSLYVNSMLNDQLFQRAAAAAQYSGGGGGGGSGGGSGVASFWTPANRFWQVMQQHNSAAQHYAAAAAAAAAAAVSSTAASCTAVPCNSTTCTTTTCTTINPSSSCIVTVDNDDERRSVSPNNSSDARLHNDHSKNSSSDGTKHQDSVQNSNNQDKKKPHIKKPLNAFMLYMKEMRAKVVAECTLKESAAINQILGRRWHALGREEQAKYYELARRERQIHMQLYPDWSSRTNATRAKKRKRKQETHDGGNNSMKKCRARYGLDQQSQWCKPCRRKKRCIRYIESGGDSGNQSDDNQSNGSPGCHSDNEEADSVSSPGGLSALSSLTSPGMLTQASLSPATPLTPHASEYECPMTAAVVQRIPQMAVVMPTRHHQPVGTNPHDINNPLSVNQLTGGVNSSSKCHRPKDLQQKSSDLSSVVVGQQQQQPADQHPNSRPLPAISVT